MPSLPFVYSNEVWTGIEYQAASHMIPMGLVERGPGGRARLPRPLRRKERGTRSTSMSGATGTRGPWLPTACSRRLSGARYDAIDGVLHLRPTVRGDFRAFSATATGYGTVGVTDGKPFLKVVSGTIPVQGDPLHGAREDGRLLKARGRASGEAAGRRRSRA